VVLVSQHEIALIRARPCAFRFGARRMRIAVPDIELYVMRR